MPSSPAPTSRSHFSRTSTKSSSREATNRSSSSTTSTKTPSSPTEAPSTAHTNVQVAPHWTPTPTPPANIPVLTSPPPINRQKRKEALVRRERSETIDVATDTHMLSPKRKQQRKPSKTEVKRSLLDELLGISPFDGGANTIHTGPRGGKYVLVKGKKVYVKA